MSQEVRDKLAVLEGWTKREHPNIAGGIWTHPVYGDRVAHPIPDDLNTCAAMWDKYAGKKGWRLYKWPRIIGGVPRDVIVAEDHATPGPGKSLFVQCSGTDAASELRDRWELLGEVLKARGV